MAEAHQWPDIKKDSLQSPWGFMSLITIPKSPTKEKTLQIDACPKQT